MTEEQKTFEDHLAEREAQNGYASTKLWNPRPHAAGMIGERELARFFGVEQDFTNKPGGDGGVDLSILMAVPIAFDVKSSRYGDYLRVNVTKVRPRTIYVLAHVNVETDTGALVGWEWAEVVKLAPTKDWCDNGVIVHFIHRDSLRPMAELLTRQVVIDQNPEVFPPDRRLRIINQRDET